MATARTALSGLLAQLAPTWSGASPVVKSGIGWPSTQQIQDVVKGGYTLVNCFDAGDGARNATKWVGQTVGILEVQPPAPGLVATLSQPTVLQPSSSVTVTLSGTPNLNDAVVFSAQPNQTTGVALLANALTGAGSTLDTLATALAASINTADLYGITASATGAVVTVSSSSSTPVVSCAANCGNQGSRSPELKRMARHVRVIVWAKSEAVRETIGNAIDLALGVLDNTGGFYLSPASPGPLGDWVHVHVDGDMLIEEQLQDIYRWDFRVMLEYGTIATEVIAPVLGTSFTFTPTVP